MEIAEIRSLIEAAIPGCRVTVAGEGCNFSVTVISDVFAGLSPVKRQQRVLAAVQEPLASGALHAISLTVLTPTEWQERAPGGSDLVQIG